MSRVETCADVLSGKEYSFMRCAACSAEFSDPMENPGPEWYSKASAYKDEGCRSIDVRRRFDVFMSLGLPAGARMLDVGCGAGEFLGRLAAAGYRNCAGIDFNPEQIKLARGVCASAELSVASLDDFLPGRAGAYALVFAFEVLEHQADPSDFCGKLKTLLAPGGLLMLSMPNAGRPFIFGGRESWDYPPHHLTRWDAGRLDGFLSARGFAKVALEDSALAEEYVYNQLFGIKLAAALKALITRFKTFFFGAGSGADAKPLDALFEERAAGKGALLRIKRLRRFPAAAIKLLARALLLPLSAALLAYYLARGHRGSSLVAVYRMK